LGIVNDVFAEGRDVQRVFVRGIGFSFGDRLRSACDFLDGWFIGRLIRFLRFFVIEFDFFLVLFHVFFDVFFKKRATGRGIGFDFFADEILLGVNNAVGKNGCFLVTNVNV